MSVDDTIAAVASAPGGAARGILRLSGDGCVACLDRCFSTEDSPPLADISRPQVLVGSLDTPPPIGRLPVELYLWPTSRSYTGQPAAELHTLGSPPLLDAALRALCAAGARPAEPGEFTMRAFLAGRIDLTQAEAVLGVIDARGEQELQTALAQLAGGLAEPLAALRNNLLDLLALLEAGLDFVEEDIEFITADELQRRLAEAAGEVEEIARRMSSRLTRDDELRVVLRGLPNVGKSSLLNALAGEDAALVSNLPGTTRDYLCRRTTLDGVSCLLIDTAGLEAAATTDGLALGAQSKSEEQAMRADVVLLCLDGSRPLAARELDELQSAAASPHYLVVLTKADLPRVVDLPCEVVATSSETGAGLEDLRAAIGRQFENTRASDARVVAGTAARCRDSLRHAAECLARAGEIAHEGLGEELVAAEVRSALDELGRVVGAVYTDDVLDRIFSRFCIGK
ncbi:MAG: tRNA modification GTPase [Pirellulaceae bacterium]